MKADPNATDAQPEGSTRAGVSPPIGGGGGGGAAIGRRGGGAPTDASRREKILNSSRLEAEAVLYFPIRESIKTYLSESVECRQRGGFKST